MQAWYGDEIDLKFTIDRIQCEIGTWFGNGLIFAMSDFDLAGALRTRF